MGGGESKMSEGVSAIHWFRKGLRLHDNPALMAILNRPEPLTLRPVFILDPFFTSSERIGINRWKFLLQCLDDLDKSLRRLGSRLYVVRGKPEVELKKLVKEWNVKMITWEEDTEPYAKKRDATIAGQCREAGVEVVTCQGHTLFNPDDVVAKNKGETPLTYQKFLSVASALGPPPQPIPAPSSLPALGKEELEKNIHPLPTLKELGFKPDELGPDLQPYLRGGETAGLERMEAKVCMSNATWVREYAKPRTSPNSLEPSSTVLSPHLKFGTVSARTIYWRLDSIYRGAKHTQPPVSLHGQLLWRDFFYCVGAFTKNFDKMEGNPICPQIPWGEDPEKLAAWTEARTGFPFIDAIMIQLIQEGWVHHLARHAVACFLTRGDLWIHWERGMQVFEKYLIDYDWSINSSNWMWLSSSAFFLPIYSPVAFGKKTDPSGAYIRKYLPRLARYPDKYIYEPWTAPLEVQEEAGCIIGEDYPYPIVDHETASKENIARMNRAYDAAKLEDSDKRKSGSSEVEEEKEDDKRDPTDKKKMKLDSFWKKFEVVPGGQPAKA